MYICVCFIRNYPIFNTNQCFLLHNPTSSSGRRKKGAEERLIYLIASLSRSVHLCAFTITSLWGPDRTGQEQWTLSSEVDWHMYCTSMWVKVAQLPCRPPRGQQVLHQRWILGIHCTHVTKHASRGCILVLKNRGDVTRSPKQGYQCPHKGTHFLQN